MKSTTARTVIFWLVVVGGFAVALSVGFSGKPQTPQPTSQQMPQENLPQITLQPKQDAQAIFDLVYLAKDGSTIKIARVGEDGSDANTIYSDTADQDKFKAVAGLKNDGSALYLLVAPPFQEFSAKLVEVSTDGKAKLKTLRDDIKFTTPPVVSPVGDKLALIVFNNEEKDFGFSVSLESLDGNDKKTTYQSTETISAVDFASDGSKLAVVKALPGGGSQIVIIDTGGSSQGVYSTNGTILSLDYETNQVIFSESPAGNNKANEVEIVKVDPDGKNVTKLTKNSFAENSLRLSPDGKTIGYLQVSYPDGLASPLTVGNLATFKLESKSENIIGKTTGVIGWVK